MFKPQLLYQIDQSLNEVACSVNFVPTFATHKNLVLISSDEPDEEKIYEEKDFCFIFVIDRSGSMGGRRMDITKEALKLFI